MGDYCRVERDLTEATFGYIDIDIDIQARFKINDSEVYNFDNVFIIKEFTPNQNTDYE